MWETIKEQYRLGSSKISQVGQKGKMIGLAVIPESEEGQRVLSVHHDFPFGSTSSYEGGREGEEGGTPTSVVALSPKPIPSA